MKSSIQRALLVCLTPVLLVACGGSDKAEAPRQSQFAGGVVHTGTTAADYNNVVQRIYVAYFGRPADPAGLAYWSDQYRAAGMPTDLGEISSNYGRLPTVRTLIDVFGDSQESHDLYPGDNDAFITAIYHNIFSREPDAAGKAFWVDVLNRGAITRAIAAVSLMAGSQGTDITVINNKIAVAASFTTSLNTPERVQAYDGMSANVVARNMLGGVILSTDPQAYQANIAAAIGTLVDIKSGGSGAGEGSTHFMTFSDGQLDMSAGKFGVIPVTGGTTSTLSNTGQVNIVDVQLQATISNNSVSNTFMRSMLMWQGQQLYRQNLTSSGGVPGGAQVSTLTRDQTCDAGVGDLEGGGPDLADASRSWKPFRLKGPDGQCNTADDTFVAVRMNMSPTDAPRAMLQPVAPIHAANGTLSGFLVRNGQAIQRVDSELANPVTMFTLPASDLFYVDSESLQSNLFVFQSGGSVYGWDAASTSAGTPTKIATLASGEKLNNLTGIDAQDDFIGLVNTTAGSVRVLRYGLSSHSVSDVGSVQGMTGIYSATTVRLTVTPTRVVVYSAMNPSMWTLPRAGGSALLVNTGSLGQSTSWAWTSGERIWIGYFTGPVVTLLTDGSAKQTMDGAQLAGCFYKPVINLQSDANSCDAVLVVQNGQVRSYDAASASVRINYGNATIAAGSATNFFSMGTLTYWGQGAVLSQMVTGVGGIGSSRVNNYFLKSDQAGLTAISLP